MIFCAPISSLELGEEVGVFFCLCTHFYFSLPTEKFLRVMNLSDRILVMYEGEIVGEFDPKTTTVQELGLYMAGARKQGKE